MQQVRCRHCDRLLCKAKFIEIELKCPRCKTLNYMKVTELQTQTPRVSQYKEKPRGNVQSKRTANS
jgi:phage FluMu protein Com